MGGDASDPLTTIGSVIVLGRWRVCNIIQIYLGISVYIVRLIGVFVGSLSTRCSIDG